MTCETLADQTVEIASGRVTRACQCGRTLMTVMAPLPADRQDLARKAQDDHAGIMARILNGNITAATGRRSCRSCGMPHFCTGKVLGGA